MAFELREYQHKMYDEARDALRTHQSILIQSPTGSGKTALAAKMLGTAASKGFPSLFNVHRQELIDQSAETFEKVGIPFGIIAAGYKQNPLQPVQICSIDSLKHRLDRLPFAPRFMLWDEAHHIAAAGWTKIKGHFPGAKHVGLSATPERLDGKGLLGQFTHMIKGPSVRWLMENIDPVTGLSYLCQYRAFAPSTPDLDNVHSRMGEYVRQELLGVMDKASITGDAIKEYQRLAPGRRAVAFCISVEHSQHVAAQFRDAGILSWHLDGTTPKLERKQAIQAFRNDQIKVLCNVDLFGEGFDLPALEVSILLRPTKSLALHLQQIGRCLRQKPHKALILDHAGNLRRHGLPDEEREWKLEGKIRKPRSTDEADIHTRQCPKCFALHPPAPKCPDCGYLYPVSGRSVERIDGELTEIDLERARAAKKWQDKQETFAAETVQELEAIGIKRGYKYPRQWAEKFIAARKGKDAKRGDGQGFY